MKNTVIITPENLGNQKLSDVFESTINDLNKVLSAGFKINMWYWSKIVKPYKKKAFCTVCFGGAALCGFLPKSKITVEIVDDINNLMLGSGKQLDGFTFDKQTTSKLEYMAHMLNAFRKGEIYVCCETWNRWICNIELNKIQNKHMDYLIDTLWVNSDYFYFGEQDDNGIKRLRTDVRKFVTQLRKLKK